MGKPAEVHSGAGGLYERRSRASGIGAQDRVGPALVCERIECHWRHRHDPPGGDQTLDVADIAVMLSPGATTLAHNGRCGWRCKTCRRVRQLPSCIAVAEELVSVDFDDVLTANAQYADNFDAPQLPGVAARGLAVIICMDSRIEPLRMLGLSKRRREDAAQRRRSRHR